METRKTLVVSSTSIHGLYQWHFDSRPFSVFRHIRQRRWISARFKQSIVELSIRVAGRQGKLLKANSFEATPKIPLVEYLCPYVACLPPRSPEMKYLYIRLKCILSSMLAIVYELPLLKALQNRFT